MAENYIIKQNEYFQFTVENIYKLPQNLYVMSCFVRKYKQNKLTRWNKIQIQM